MHRWPRVGVKILGDRGRASRVLDWRGHDKAITVSRIWLYFPLFVGNRKLPSRSSISLSDKNLSPIPATLWHFWHFSRRTRADRKKIGAYIKISTTSDRELSNESKGVLRWFLRRSALHRPDLITNPVYPPDIVSHFRRRCWEKEGWNVVETTDCVERLWSL